MRWSTGQVNLEDVDRDCCPMKVIFNTKYLKSGVIVLRKETGERKLAGWLAANLNLATGQPRKILHLICTDVTEYVQATRLGINYQPLTVV